MGRKARQNAHPHSGMADSPLRIARAKWKAGARIPTELSSRRRTSEIRHGAQELGDYALRSADDSFSLRAVTGSSRAGPPSARRGEAQGSQSLARRHRTVQRLGGTREAWKPSSAPER